MATSLICSDLTVVELGDGRIAAMILADNGARVVTVEPPTGDRLRTSLPSGWLVWNRGKESLVADRVARGIIKVAQPSSVTRSGDAGRDSFQGKSR